MRVTFARSLMHDDIEFTIQIDHDELTGLPGWCMVLLQDIKNHYGRPLEIIDAIHSIAHQIHNQHKRSLDTPPPLEGTLKAETQEVGSGTTGETVDVRDTIGTAPETYGAPASEGCEENGGVVQGKSCGCKCLNITRFEDVEGIVDDIDNRVARLETWAMHVVGLRHLVDRPTKGN